MLNKLASLLKLNARISIILKSGKEIRFKCKNIEWTHKGNEITSYEATGIVGSRPTYIRIEEIAAIIRRW